MFISIYLDSNCWFLEPGQNPDYKVLTSGCSQYIPGFNATFNADFDQCCQQLDYCYANCTAEKYLCDRQLKSCTDAVCQNVNLTISGIFDRLSKWLLWDLISRTKRFLLTVIIFIECEALQGSLRPRIEGREHCSLVAITRVRACCV